MMLDSTVQIAIIGVFSASLSIVSPIIMATIQNSNARRIKADDNARLDELEARRIAADEALLRRQDTLASEARLSSEKASLATTEAASLLLASNKQMRDATLETADRLLNSNQKLEVTTKATDVKLDVIHTLVNSEKTAGMQVQVDTLRLHLLSLKEILSLKVAAGQPASSEATSQITVVEGKIADLQKAIDERLTADKLVQDQMKAAAGEAILKAAEIKAAEVPVPVAAPTPPAFIPTKSVPATTLAGLVGQTADTVEKTAEIVESTAKVADQILAKS